MQIDFIPGTYIHYLVIVKPSFSFSVQSMERIKKEEESLMRRFQKGEEKAFNQISLFP